MKYDLKYCIKNNIAINCKTEQEASMLISLLDETPVEKGQLLQGFLTYGTETCYRHSPHYESWQYGNVSFYKKVSAEIISSETFFTANNRERKYTRAEVMKIMKGVFSCAQEYEGGGFKYPTLEDLLKHHPLV